MTGSYFSADTIAAVATSLAGDAGVGIIRISGPSALIAAQTLVRGMEKPEGRYLHRIQVIDSVSNEVLDDGLGVYFPAGASFTGEEVVEVQVHGGRALLQMILSKFIETGKCRMALPGEFSFRAVRNGRLSLSQAEAVGQAIAAQSEFEARRARAGISQSRIAEVERIAAKIRDLLAKTELSIDFIDQDVEVIAQNDLLATLERLSTDVASVLQRTQCARRIAKGLLVVLSGKPNAGKSTLFNALLSEDRAIVSEIAGTTRDVITEEFWLRPYRVRLADTAGLREASDQIELEGVGRARDLLVSADAVLHVIDSTEETDFLNFEASPKTILVMNKWDALSDTQQKRVQDRLQKNDFARYVLVSASKQEGMEALFLKLREVLDRDNAQGLDSFLPTEFQLQMLLQCADGLHDALSWVRSTGLNRPEMISAALLGAARSLSDLAGETTPDTVLTKIFSEFCIGK